MVHFALETIVVCNYAPAGNVLGILSEDQCTYLLFAHCRRNNVQARHCWLCLSSWICQQRWALFQEFQKKEQQQKEQEEAEEGEKQEQEISGMMDD